MTDLTNPDSTAKNTYSKFMDRILSAVGFECTATSTDGKENSHMAVMTADTIQKPPDILLLILGLHSTR